MKLRMLASWLKKPSQQQEKQNKELEEPLTEFNFQYNSRQDLQLKLF